MATAKMQFKKLQGGPLSSENPDFAERKPPIFRDFPHKKSIEEIVEKIKKRDLSEPAHERVEKIIKRFPRFKIGEEKGSRQIVSHLSPNRSIFEFDQHFNPDYSMINTFFQEAFLLFVLPD